MSSFFCAGDGDEFSEGFRCDDDAGGVHACSADETFEAERGVDEFFDLGVALVGGGEHGGIFKSLIDGDADGERNHLGDTVDLAVGHV